ncbi:MAG TPA: GTPase ObgE [Candidatus Saccharimonadales bacterium]|nr:GTPase ObgE [Candidatus Saccharimonadales bacterium]
MNFIDHVTVTLQAGNGGNGIVSFRHEKFVDRGGPDGGDGGDGGSIILQASRNQNTLLRFRYQKEVVAENGRDGGKVRKHGRSAPNTIVPVPVGTSVVDDETGEVLADLTADDQTAVIAKGGKGGFGNAHFLSSRRQAPRIAEKGDRGELRTVRFELKMIADVGLVGLPNAGKSTLLSVVSNARPEIADYPFTTLTPNLGVVDVDGQASLLFADIPGLIEGAAAGKGLGDDFLRHVERTAVLLHLVEAYQPDVAATYKTIQAELKAYKVDLSKKPQVVALTKIEGLDDEIVRDQLAQLKKAAPKGTPICAISAHTKQGVPELLRTLKAIVETERARQAELEPAEAELPVLRIENTQDAWTVTKLSEHHFMVQGKKVERFAARTDFSSEAGLQRLRDIMRKMGIMHGLVRQGVEPEDKVTIGDAGSFEY